MAISIASVNPTLSAITNVHFGRLSAKEIEDISVRRIHVATSLDTFQNPIPGGLYDPALGPILDRAYAIETKYCTSSN